MAELINLGNPLFDPSHDAFNRQPFSATVADRIVSLGSEQGAVVIGLYGKWGYGKTTVLNFIKHELNKSHENSVSMLEFNPWLFQTQDDLIKEFFSRLTTGLGLPPDRNQTVAKALTKFHGAGGLVPFVGSGVMTAIKQIGEHYLNTSEKEKDAVSRILEKNRKTIVVFIDDLDRLDRAEVLLMLKLVRLIANLPKVVYVLAFDDEVIANAINTAYAHATDGGRQFLEKIIQFPLSIPAVGQDRLVDYVEERVHDACKKAAIELSNNSWQTFRELLDKHLAVRLTTPRQAVRYGAAVEFALPMLAGEVDPLQQLVVEALRILFPETYAQIRENRSNFCKADSSGLQNLVAEQGNAEKAACTTLLSFLKKEVSGDRRIECSVSSEMYFDRYFEYSLRVVDIRHADFVQFLNLIRDDKIAEAISAIRKLGKHNSRQLVRMLDESLWKFSTTTISALAKLLVSNGDAYRFEEPLYRDVCADKMIDLLRNLIGMLYKDEEGISPDETHKLRENLVGELVRDAKPPALALRLLEKLEAMDAGLRVDQKFTLLSENGLSQLWAQAISLISEIADHYSEKLFTEYTDACYLFSIWRSRNSESFQNWFGELLRRKPSESITLITFLGGIDGSTVLLEKWVEPSVVLNALDLVCSPESRDVRKNDYNVRKAQAFLRRSQST